MGYIFWLTFCDGMMTDALFLLDWFIFNQQGPNFYMICIQQVITSLSVKVDLVEKNHLLLRVFDQPVFTNYDLFYTNAV